ncbi:T6SS immunity protein Tli4 family protein [Massilia varians]|uniref:T6SS immunity protein Tli4 family protein n=1 Tax=Massilia varians TaxID=457921 RepID=UPI002556B706|nr:T6SS immunity protein Tli4 family protein [Massilia varians]MDK6078432.1 T6SS immunity protein Tli4 family protein [Massilia varians]
MKPNGRWRVGAVGGALLAALAGIGAYAAIDRKQDIGKVQAMTQQMKTVCVGRLLIDVPADARVVYRQASVGGATFSAAPGSTPETLASSLKEVRELLTGAVNELDMPSFEKQADVDAIDFKATVMYYNRKKPSSWFENGQRVSSGEQAITVEAYGLKNDVLYHFKAVDTASPRYEKNVEGLIGKFESRSEDAIPTQSGFCADRSLVHDPIPADDHEQVTVFVALKGYPDVAIRLDSAVQDKPVTSLLERDVKNEGRLVHPERTATLRKGVRPLNGIEGEEVLLRIKEENGTTGHFAMWASRNKVGDVMALAITLEIETGRGKRGERVNASLSDEALMQLWDKVSATLRIRPTAQAGQKRASPATSKLSLGEMSATGAVCPETGYWECTEGGSVVGGRRQFFRAGERLPQVLVSGTPSLWQKLSGNRPQHRVDTVWTLVDYEKERTVQAAPPQGADMS